MLNTWLSEFQTAWTLFIKLPLPKFLREEQSEYPEIDGHGAMTRPLMPLLGFVLGLMLVIPLWFLRLLPRGVLMASLAGTMILPLVLELAGSWRGLNSLVAYFDLKRQGATQEEALLAAPASINQPHSAASCIFLLTFYALRMAFSGILAYCAPFWIVIALTGGWLVRAELACLNGIDGSSDALIRTRSEWEKRHWHIALVLMILFGIMHPFAAVLGFCVAWLAAYLSANFCLNVISGVNRNAFEMLGYCAELILMFLGVLLFAAPQ